MSTAGVRAGYEDLLKQIHSELPGGRFSLAEIRQAVEIASQENGNLRRSAHKSAKRTQPPSAKPRKRDRKAGLSQGHLRAAVAKKR